MVRLRLHRTDMYVNFILNHQRYRSDCDWNTLLSVFGVDIFCKPGPFVAWRDGGHSHPPKHPVGCVACRTASLDSKPRALGLLDHGR